MRRSSRCSRWRWSSGIGAPHRSQRSSGAAPGAAVLRPAVCLRDRAHPRDEPGTSPRGLHLVEAAHTATRIPPSSSRGIGASCSGSFPAARPARGQIELHAAFAAAQHPTVELAVVQRRAAPRAGVAVREQRALHVGHHQRDALGVQRPQPARLEAVRAIERHPARAAAVAAAIPVDDRELGAPDVHHGQLDAARPRLRHALDLQAGQIGRVLVQRLLDGELQRGLRRGTAAAASLQPQARDAVVETQQLDVAAVGLHVGPHACRAPRRHASGDRPDRDRGSAGGWPPSRPPPARRESPCRRRRHRRARARCASSPSPYISITAPTSSCASARARSSSSASTRSLSAWTRSTSWSASVYSAMSVLLSWASLAQLSPVGVCMTLRTFPAPVYMCTPHGRHGSKLRTARMMSMPLKFSGPFSSKIGVFCTASS